MAITIPIHAKIAFNSERALDEPVLLMDVSDASLGSTVRRICSYPIMVVSVDPLTWGVVLADGVTTYEYFMSGTMPPDQQGTPLNTTLVLDNVTMELTDEFVGLTVDNSVTLTLILASDPDTPIRSFPALAITQVSVSEDSLSLTLNRNKNIMGESSSVEPWPSGRQTMNNAPGLHK